jgi:hypothetical protein
MIFEIMLFPKILKIKNCYHAFISFCTIEAFKEEFYSFSFSTIITTAFVIIQLLDYFIQISSNNNIRWLN